MIYFDACLLQIVFLGNGRSGKTSLLRTLAKKPLKSDENSTRGVTVDAFADDLQPGILTRKKFGRDLEMSFWDFAGQLEYSAAHEFFLSERQAVYVVVYNVLEDDDNIQQQRVASQRRFLRAPSRRLDFTRWKKNQAGWGPSSLVFFGCFLQRNNGTCNGKKGSWGNGGKPL